MNRVILFLSLLAIQASAQFACPTDSVVAHRMYIIDGVIKGPLVNCSYSINLTSGNCTLNTGETDLVTPNYVCFSDISETCYGLNFAAITGIAARNCEGNVVSEPFSVPTVRANEEFVIDTSFLAANATIGIICVRDEEEQPVLGWNVRNCTIMQPTPEPTDSYGAGLQVGLLMLVLVISGMLVI